MKAAVVQMFLAWFVKSDEQETAKVLLIAVLIICGL